MGIGLEFYRTYRYSSFSYGKGRDWENDFFEKTEVGESQADDCACAYRNRCD